jgi:hypothetical protein
MKKGWPTGHPCKPASFFVKKDLQFDILIRCMGYKRCLRNGQDTPCHNVGDSAHSHSHNVGDSAHSRNRRARNRHVRNRHVRNRRVHNRRVHNHNHIRRDKVPQALSFRASCPLDKLFRLMCSQSYLRCLWLYSLIEKKDSFVCLLLALYDLSSLLDYDPLINMGTFR